MLKKGKKERRKMQNKRYKSLIQLFFVALIVLVAWRGLSEYQQSRYVEGVYDCSNMSVDCALFFRMVRIPTKIVSGYCRTNHSIEHCWVRLFDFVDLESTTLLLRIDNSDYIFLSEVEL
jgi:hypothetical protein